MENLPYLVIEGMIMAGLVTGAHKGILYIRHEYENSKEVLQEEIDRCYRNGVLGERVLGSDLTFDLEIFVSPGGYICGEESALLEAIEGKRAEPRNKPPFPGTNGLWNQPTVINNVETFCLATVILARGVDWYKAQGKNGSLGVKFVGISGDVVRPGIFEVPMGTTYAELIFEYAGGIPDGKQLLAFAPSGPSSGYLARLDDELCRWTGTRWRRRVRWWDRAPLWCAPKAVACWTWRSTPLASTATSLAASACPAAWARRRWSRC